MCARLRELAPPGGTHATYPSPFISYLSVKEKAEEEREKKFEEITETAILSRIFHPGTL